MADLPALRRRYAEMLRATASVRTDALIEAFARVPRERFLGPGPWRIMVSPNLVYATTPDADPAHLYRDVLVAIDAERFLNNGQPSGLARWFDALALRPGARVLHVGCGVGYYTAVLAETVGAEGQVTGIELDAQLAACAAANLTYLPHAVVLQGDGGTINTGPRDAIFINAGATHPLQLWLDQLAPDGRLVMPLTASLNADTPDDLGMGLMLRVVRTADRYAADFFSPVGIYPCLGTRDAEAKRSLRDSFARGNWESVRWLRHDPHDQTATCWFHRSDVCLST